MSDYAIAESPADSRNSTAHDRTDRGRVSIIIPTRNEEKALASTLEALRDEPAHEIFVVDGCSTDDTVSIAHQFEFVRVLTASPSRGGQMNVAAAHATGDILVFLHADTLPPTGFVQMIRDTIENTQAICGAFALRIAGQRRSYRILERLVHWRSRARSMPYGDQALFLRRSTFNEIGGFPEIPLLEDVALIRTLRRKGRIVTLDKQVETSDRRWRRRGVWRTAMLNQVCLLAYLCRISPHHIARWRGNWRSGGD